MKNVDVIIIGAGVAGATAAFHLAKEGINVTLLDKGNVKSLRPCAGGMAASVQNWFPFELEPIVEETIRKVVFTWHLSDKVEANLPGSSPFWIVAREKLDQFLVNKAVNEGADNITSCEVIDICRNQERWQITSKEGLQIESKGLIIADGSNSPWPTTLNLGPQKPYFASTTSVRLNGRGLLEKGTSLFEFGLVRHGFAWAFPMGEFVNVGVGTFVGKDSTDRTKVLEKLLPSIGFSADSGIRTVSKLRVWNGHHPLDGNGVIAIGDAASLCDPFLAEGIRPAILSGFEGAKAMKEWINGNSKRLTPYTKAIKKDWGISMSWGKRISQVFYRLPRLGYQLGIKRPTAPQRIAQILSGEMTYEAIAKRVIRRLLLKRN